MRVHHHYPQHPPPPPPPEVVNHPSLKSICYHPSLLPRHRGASAISWTLIEGDTQGGFSIFYPDDGLDTGDLLLTRCGCHLHPNLHHHHQLHHHHLHNPLPSSSSPSP